MTGAVVERYLRLKQEIADLARAAGHAPDSVRLIAASKTHSPETIQSLIEAGLADFGENMVQEALPKIGQLRAHPLTWHFIGHLQSNKAKNIPDNFAWLHSLDSLALASRLEKFAAERNATLNALIEVNIAGDSRKHGIAPKNLDALLESLQRADLRHITLRGLMTIGPYPASTAEKRKHFGSLRGLRDAVQSRLSLSRFDQLSMGMSDDYPEAIAEGATMARIGTAIFGERDYSV